MKEVKNINDIYYYVEKNWPIDGVDFIDLTPTLIKENAFKKIANLIKDQIITKTNEFDYIIAPDARGFIWGSYIAALLEKPLIPIRKHGKLPNSCVMSRISDKTEYSNIQLDLPISDLKNKKCVFIDDVYATGGTYTACKKLVEMNGGTLDPPYVVLDILLTEDNVNSLITKKDLK